MGFLEPLIPISLFFSVAAVVVLRGPLGRALADRIAHRRGGLDDGQSGEIEGRLEDVQYRLQELEERLDFTERIVAQERNIERLEGGH
jgi:hypothetical protein